MTKRVQRFGLVSATLATTVGLARELIMDLTNGTITLHDGATSGGIPMARKDLGNVAAATGAVNGVMSAADKTKLDGIASGATNVSGNSTAGTITAVNPGNVQAAGVSALYARADHVHPVTGFPTSTTNTTSMVANLVLDHNSSAYQVFNPQAESLYVVLSDATTETAATPGRFVLRNDGIYWVGVKNSAGTIISFVGPHRTIVVDLESISVASGPWHFRIGDVPGEAGIFARAIDAYPLLMVNSLFIDTIALTDTTFLVLQADASGSTTANIKGYVVVVSPMGLTTPSSSPVALVAGDLTNTPTDIGSGFQADFIDATHVFLQWNSTADSKLKCGIITITANVPALGTAADIGTGVPAISSCSVNPGGATALSVWKVAGVMHVAHTGISGATVSPGTEATYTPANTLAANPIVARTNSATQGFIAHGTSGTVGIVARMINTNGATTTPTTTLGTTENIVSTLSQYVSFAYAGDATHAVISYEWGDTGTGAFGGRAKVLTLGASDFSAVGSEVGINNNASTKVGTGTESPHLVRVSATTAYAFVNPNLAAPPSQIVAYPLVLSGATLTPMPAVQTQAFGKPHPDFNSCSDIRTIVSSGGRALLHLENYGTGGTLITPTCLPMQLAEAA